MITALQINKFWGRVNCGGSPDVCWNWMKGKTSAGYGHLWWFDKVKYAHRVAYELIHGEIPAGKIMGHKCDNPSCVNPNNLFVTNGKGNSEDMVAKGRSMKGEKQPMSKFTNQQVLDVRAKYATGNYTLQKLADEYGVWPPAIHKIVNFARWKHLKPNLVPDKTDTVAVSETPSPAPLETARI